MGKRRKRSEKPSRKPPDGAFSRWGGPFQGIPRGWVEVACAPDRLQAGLLESALKEAGIPVVLRMPVFFPYTGSGGEHGVAVPEDFQERAREVLAEMWDLD